MVDLSGAAVVAILTRAPSSGGKRRLFHQLGRDPDPALLAALLLDTVSAIPRGIATVVVVEPAQSVGEVRALVPGSDVIGQTEGTLGERMAAAMQALFNRGARRVALVGSDLPDLPGDRLTDVFAILDRDPSHVVIGPAADGGYYVIGCTYTPQLFDGIDWGTTRVLEQTLALARERGISVTLIGIADDVDTVADLVRVRARRTRAWVQRHLGGEQKT